VLVLQIKVKFWQSPPRNQQKGESQPFNAGKPCRPHEDPAY